MVNRLKNVHTRFESMEIGNSSHSSLFSPEKQGEFWGRVTPDVRGMLQFFELKESWTVSYSELPEFYQSIDKVVKSMQEAKENRPIEELVDKLIILFGSMPLRQCMAGLSWIDRDIKKDSDIKWASNMYFRSCDITNGTHEDDDVTKHAFVIKERIELVGRMNLLNSLFAQFKI